MNDEIQRAVEEDLIIILVVVAGICLSFVIFGSIDKPKRWIMLIYATMSVGVSVMAVYGLAGWFVLIKIAIHYPGKKQTNKQTTTHTNKQTNKQTNTQTHKKKKKKNKKRSYLMKVEMKGRKGTSPVVFC